MNGHLCRCATYLRIREAIHKAAAMSPAQRPTETARAQAARQE
jgi:xanthine dehydrogenase iron-sulfur cluster and FAD-binding subunit A